MKKLFVTLMVLVFAVVASGATLRWGTPTTGPTPDGYRLYWGSESRNYDETIEVGNALEYEIGDRVGYGAATSLFGSKESVYSNEIKAEELVAWVVNDGSCVLFYRPDASSAWVEAGNQTTGEYKVIVYTQEPEVVPPVIALGQ